MRNLSILLIAVLQVSLLAAQQPAGAPPAGGAAPTGANRNSGPKAFRELITDKAVSDEGMISVHKLDGRYYWEIPDSLMGRAILAVTRLSKTSTGASWAGIAVNEQLLQWEKLPDHRLLLRCMGIVNLSPDSTHQIFTAVQNSNTDPIIGAFDIRAYRKDTSMVIDVTDFIRSDNQSIGVTPSQKQFLRLGGQIPDRSYISSMKSFPMNTEIKVVRTFSASIPPPIPGVPPSMAPRPLPAAIIAGVATIELNTSLVLLPKTPYRKRMEDRRVGYFTNDYNVYTDESQRVQTQRFIKRWRLEPKNREDYERARRGEAIEPAKPIVYYIDPATPKQWVKYLIAGVEDWRKTFEKAGWKNAIQAKEWPVGDTTMSLDDSRYSVIRYLAADFENAQGPSTMDPRSGEIIESHIYWYHNVMNIFKHLYAIQVGHLDPRAQKPDFDEALMGRLIRYVASHEVGHTLGLLHNHGSSIAVPVEKLRDKEYIKKYGHSTSIMEYARFNYVAQPEDGIDIEDFFPRINTYDDWAIEWGYKLIFDSKDERSDVAVLDSWVSKHLGDPRYWYAPEQHPYDPRMNSEDLGDNQMKSNEYGIKNLKKILPLQVEWTREPGKTWDYLSERYSRITGALFFYFNHVFKYIGGVYETYKKTDEPGVVYSIVPKARQREAIDFLRRHLFETPHWLLEPEVLSRIRPDQGVEAIRGLQENFLYGIFSRQTMTRIIESAGKDKDAYKLDELFEDMRKIVWTELDQVKPIDQFRRNLQKTYIERMIWLLEQKAVAGDPGERDDWGIVRFGGLNMAKSDIHSLAKAEIKLLQNKIAQVLPQTKDKMSRYHLEDIQDRIKKVLNAK